VEHIADRMDRCRRRLAWYRCVFERALKHRSEYEQPWLPEVVPFHAMGGKRVLEVGFRPGYDALTFLQNGAIYCGIDITPENIQGIEHR
jgi:hypothetical protein